MLARFALLSLLGACWLLGCQSGPTQASLAGKYKAEMATTEAKKEGAEAVAEGFANAMAGSMTLDLKVDGTFSMTAIFLPVQGKWTVSGNTVTLTPETVMGMPADAKKDDGGNKPMVFVVGDGGKTLTPQDQDASGQQMVFKRE